MTSAPLRGLMMDEPLTITAILEHALTVHPHVEVVSLTGSDGQVRLTYGGLFRRAAQLAHALHGLGLEPGDRVATLAWNDHRHLEAYYATSCSGLVCHTINPRLFGEQIAWIINHAEDRVLLLDPGFVPLVESIAARLDRMPRLVALCGGDGLPETGLPVVDYESFIGAHPDSYPWPRLDENAAAALCYTSGTTGHPKGVLYSHRSTLLHAYAALMTDALGLGVADTVMPVVPMFHVNAWGVPYMAPMAGSRLVLPGPHMGDPATLQRLVNEEGVTHSLAVPTVWLMMRQHLEQHGGDLKPLRRVIVGGAACPPALMQWYAETQGVELRHGWGMTEMSPMGVTSVARPELAALPAEEQARYRAKQGLPLFGMRLRVVDDEGRELPRDGRSSGHLQARGPWVCSAYYRPDEDPGTHRDGWFDTGDVATIDAWGYMQITDRAKDVIKSGGEWISSIELENIAMAHPDVAEAAVVARADPKWQERPVLVVVPRADSRLDPEAVRAFYQGRVASWWIPDEVIVVDELPHTATGKVAKRVLREQLAERLGLT